MACVALNFELTKNTQNLALTGELSVSICWKSDHVFLGSTVSTCLRQSNQDDSVEGC